MLLKECLFESHPNSFNPIILSSNNYLIINSLCILYFIQKIWKWVNFMLVWYFVYQMIHWQLWTHTLPIHGFGIREFPTQLCNFCACQHVLHSHRWVGSYNIWCNVIISWCLLWEETIHNRIKRWHSSQGKKKCKNNTVIYLLSWVTLPMSHNK